MHQNKRFLLIVVRPITASRGLSRKWETDVTPNLSGLGRCDRDSVQWSSALDVDRQRGRLDEHLGKKVKQVLDFVIIIFALVIFIFIFILYRTFIFLHTIV